MFNSALKKVFGTKHQREVKRMQPTVAAISALEDDIKKLTDAQLRGKTAEFRQQLDNGAPLDDLMVPAYAVAREAAKRVLGMRHYDVQLVGGIVLHQGKI
ncbi:MAG: preprotein translocase subunit SecA, partial [Deltaproteobacteria bacterium]|nr:preprotein translocase subunit SecA [Deltaproteobacteria bacterium]